MMAQFKDLNHKHAETDREAGRFKRKSKTIKQQTVDTIVDAIAKKHKHLSRDMIESIAQIEVSGAFEKKTFIGPK